MRICCDKCNGMIIRRNLKRHQETRKCTLESNRNAGERIVIDPNNINLLEATVMVDQDIHVNHETVGQDVIEGNSTLAQDKKCMNSHI